MTNFDSEVSYIADQKLSALTNCIWLLICLFSSGVAVFLIDELYVEWTDQPVITTLENTAKPTSEIPFPTVTICSPGLFRDNVQTSLEKSFNRWRLGKDKSWDRLDIPMLMAEFLEEKFQIREREVNLIDILNMMITPGGVDTILAANGVRENAQACALKASRERRSGNFQLLK